MTTVGGEHLTADAAVARAEISVVDPVSTMPDRGIGMVGLETDAGIAEPDG